LLISWGFRSPTYSRYCRRAPDGVRFGELCVLFWGYLQLRADNPPITGCRSFPVWSGKCRAAMGSLGIRRPTIWVRVSRKQWYKVEQKLIFQVSLTLPSFPLKFAT
jgi:hypothetical protein